MIERQYRQLTSCQHLRAVVILDVNRRRSICSWFEYLGGSAAIFFAYSPCFVRVALFRSRAIEGWRGVVRSMPMCIYAVGVYTYGIFGGSYKATYVVYVWTGRIRMEYRS